MKNGMMRCLMAAKMRKDSLHFVQAANVIEMKFHPGKLVLIADDTKIARAFTT